VHVSPLEFRSLLGAFLERYRSTLFFACFSTAPRSAFLVRRHAVLIAESSAMYRSVGEFS